MLSGNNGILNRASEAKVATRAGEVQETIALEAMNNAAEGYAGGGKKSRYKIINELLKSGKLTQEEADSLTDENNPVDEISIGGITIDFSVLGSATSKTIEEAYDLNCLKIGDKLTYSSNGQSDWIVFGKELNNQGQETGNILITTENPIENGFNLKGGAEAWLKYESDTDTTYGLNKVCSAYGGTIQRMQVHSRSIKMEDINYVAGLQPKNVTVGGNTYNIQSFDTYHFGKYTNPNFSAGEVNRWYPILSGGTGANGTGTGFWKKPVLENEMPFKNDWYCYYLNTDDNKCYYYGADTDDNEVDASTLGMNTDKLQYVLGGNTNETFFKMYLVASRSTYIDSYGTRFYVAYVGYGGVNSGNCYLCSSFSDKGTDDDDVGLYGIRPVVILPSGLIVEKKANGSYDLAQ